MPVSFSFWVRSLRRVGLALTLLFVMVASPQEATAQRWLQTAQLEIELEKKEWMEHDLVDSLTSVLHRRDSLTVARGPDQKKRPFSALKNQLLEEDSIGVSSASHVRIRYKFTIENRGFEETITSFHFLYRPGPEHEPISLLYVDGEKPWLRSVLKTRAIPTTGSCVPDRPIYKGLVFARLHEDANILEIAGNDVRNGFEEKKRKLVKKITRLTYQSM